MIQILALQSKPATLQASPRYLRLRPDARNFAAKFLKRLVQYSPGQILLQDLPIKNPYPENWPLSEPRPAFVKISPDIYLLHFSDNSALLATPSQNTHLCVHPLVLRTSRIVRWARTPFTWIVVQSGINTTPVSIVRQTRALTGGTEISSGQAIDNNDPISASRILEFRNEVAREAAAWIKDFKVFQQHNPHACPAPLCEFYKTPDKEVEAKALAWIRDLCTYLQVRSRLEVRVSISVEIRQPRQNHPGMPLLITSTSNASSIGANPTQDSVPLEEKLQPILLHPDCPCHPSKLVVFKTPATGKIRISPPKDLKFSGAGHLSPSRHHLLNIIQKYQALDI